MSFSFIFQVYHSNPFRQQEAEVAYFLNRYAYRDLIIRQGIQSIRWNRVSPAFTDAIEK